MNTDNTQKENFFSIVPDPDENSFPEQYESLLEQEIELEQETEKDA